VDAENTPEVQAHFTWLKGSHAIKTGYDMLFCQFNTFRPDYPSGTFSFGRAYTQGADPSVASAAVGYGLASAMLGSPDGGSFTVGLAGAVADQLQLVSAGRLEGIEHAHGEPGSSFRIPDAV
jgi:hypothetical protein